MVRLPNLNNLAENNKQSNLVDLDSLNNLSNPHKLHDLNLNSLHPLSFS